MARKRKARLTKRQLAQRKYAARIKTLRKRASKRAGGKGRVAKRSGAYSLRRRLGIRRGR